MSSSQRKCTEEQDLGADHESKSFEEARQQDVIHQQQESATYSDSALPEMQGPVERVLPHTITSMPQQELGLVETFSARPPQHPVGLISQNSLQEMASNLSTSSSRSSEQPQLRTLTGITGSGTFTFPTQCSSYGHYSHMGQRQGNASRLFPDPHQSQYVSAGNMQPFSVEQDQRISQDREMQLALLGMLQLHRRRALLGLPATTQAFRLDQVPISLQSFGSFVEDQQLLSRALQSLPGFEAGIPGPYFMSPGVTAHGQHGLSEGHNMPLQGRVSSSSAATTLSLPAPMNVPYDDEVLAEYQIFLRQNIEYFEAGRGEVDNRIPGRHKEVFPGQVGIRCIHCSGIPIYRRPIGSVYFPSTLEWIYQLAQKIGKIHFESGKCSHMSSQLQEKIRLYRPDGRKASASQGGRRYWEISARAMGIVERPGEGGGLVFLPPTSPPEVLSCVVPEMKKSAK